jgi:deoxyribodipyrimidine photolyase-related protein
MTFFILYPHHLFESLEPLRGHKILLVEESFFFTYYRFHVQKLILHRASMKFYEAYLIENGFDVEYLEDDTALEKYQNNTVTLYDPIDDYLNRKIHTLFSSLTILPNPNFLNTSDTSKFLHTFYLHRRQELGIFIDSEGKPFGGKWSTDSENRKKIPKNFPKPPPLYFQNRYLDEAREYVKKFESVGECEVFAYPVTFEEARMSLEYFLRTKFAHFGDFQDAMDESNNPFLFHSNLSSSLNIGLLGLRTLIDAIASYDAPYNAKEGFIRQIIGWREFMLRIYKDSGVAMRTANVFGFTHALPSVLLNQQSRLLPFDDAMSKLYSNAYGHHIERLMIMGNLFLLLEINPDEVHAFFMQYYIDAYDWVMVGNVYGMSQFSDGGSITTKPYISSSNYILKMSHYPKGQWCEIWDGLYWRFLHRHRERFRNSHRMGMQLALLEKMNPLTLEKHLEKAKHYFIFLGLPNG